MGKRTVFSTEDKALCLRVLKKLKKICRINGKDILLVEKAYAFAYDKHDGVFADAGSVSSIEVIEKAGDKGHGDVSDDVTAGDAESDADAAGPAGKNGNTDAAEQYIDDLAEGSEFRTKEDPREENRESSEGDRDFSGQRDGDRSQNASNCGAEGAENKIMCCQFHVV